MILALLLTLAGEPSADFDRCMALAHAVRPAQHCRAVEIERRDGLIAARVKTHADAAGREGAGAVIRAQRDWSAAMETRCFALSRLGTGSLGSERAQACRLDEQARRLQELSAAARS